VGRVASSSSQTVDVAQEIVDDGKIVCWRHNWDDCPAQIEIVELSSVIKSFPNSED
jgi:hypothetical protein